MSASAHAALGAANEGPFHSKLHPASTASRFKVQTARMHLRGWDLDATAMATKERGEKRDLTQHKRFINLKAKYWLFHLKCSVTPPDGALRCYSTYKDK